MRSFPPRDRSAKEIRNGRKGAEGGGDAKSASQIQNDFRLGFAYDRHSVSFAHISTTIASGLNYIYIYMQLPLHVAQEMEKMEIQERIRGGGGGGG